MKIGIICPSEIAFRRFMPALEKCEDFDYVGIGVCRPEERFSEEQLNSYSQSNIQKTIDDNLVKANKFVENYGGKIFEGYEEIATSDEIDALYIPLPPALHYKWAKVALEAGKHVMVEKPSTIHALDTKELVSIANNKNLALHENYMFVFHNQLKAINDIVDSGEIGEVRLYRISFGFPKRAKNDFRYNKSMGGGALIDAGGYTLRYATMLLGPTARIQYAQMNYTDEFDVDIYGSAALVNDDGVTAQISYGMDNNYKCELEVWGSKGCLTTGRILTAPAGFTPSATIRKGNEDRTIELPADDAFEKSILFFGKCIRNENDRAVSYDNMIKQAELIDSFKEKAGFE